MLLVSLTRRFNSLKEDLCFAPPSFFASILLLCALTCSGNIFRIGAIAFLMGLSIDLIIDRKLKLIGDAYIEHKDTAPHLLLAWFIGYNLFVRRVH